MMDKLREMLAPHTVSKAARLRACMWVTIFAAVIEGLGALLIVILAPTWLVGIPIGFTLAFVGIALHCRDAAARAQESDPDHG